MKTIIACTDFTESSENACNYAAMLAKKLNCKLLLFNLHETPFIHTNIGLVGVTNQSKVKLQKNSMPQLMSDLQKKYPDLEINRFVSNGKFKDEIKELSKLHKIQFAVLGLESKEKISKFIYGSHSIGLAGKIETSVIIVPSNYKKHELSRIVLTVDSNEKLNTKHLKNFEKFVKKAACDVSVLHVRSEDEIFHPLTLKVSINSKKIPVQFVKSQTLEDGLKTFYKKEKDDMIAILSKKHSSFFNLFLESHTKRIVFAVNVPVLSIHD